MTRAALNRTLAEILRDREPALCRELENALRRGIKPAALQAEIDRAGGCGLLAGLVNAFLRGVDGDFRREEEAREEESRKDAR